MLRSNPFEKVAKSSSDKIFQRKTDKKIDFFLYVKSKELYDSFESDKKSCKNFTRKG